jgi:hypothetical protein
LPLSVCKIYGSYTLNVPKLQTLECHPYLLEFFDGINLDIFLVHRKLTQIKIKTKNPFINAKIQFLILFKTLTTIQEGFFDDSFFKTISCYIHHIKYLNKNGVSLIYMMDENTETIYSNTFHNFINLEIVVLPENLKKIESKAFNNCNNLKSIKIPDSCTNVVCDSFYQCDKLEIDCKDEIKEKLKPFIKLDKTILRKKDLNNYTSVQSLEIDFNSSIGKNALNKLTNLSSIKCNPEILNKLPLNNNLENNITTLIIQDGTKN